DRDERQWWSTSVLRTRVEALAGDEEADRHDEQRDRAGRAHAERAVGRVQADGADVHRQRLGFAADATGAVGEQVDLGEDLQAPDGDQDGTSVIMVRTPGTVTVRKVRTGPAPSTAAAS